MRRLPPPRRRPALVAFAILAAFGVPVVLASPATAATCPTLGPCPEPTTVIDMNTGTPAEPQVSPSPFDERSSRVATFNITVSPEDTDVSYQCRLEREGVTQPVVDWRDCTVTTTPDGQPDVGHFTYSGLLLGTYIFRARATKFAALPSLATPTQDSTPDTYVWTVVPPPPENVAGAPDTSMTHTPNFWHLEDFVSVDLHASEPAAEYRCTYEGSPVGCPNKQLNVFGIGAGDHRIGASAVDLEGIVDPTPAHAAFTVPQRAANLRGFKGGWTLRYGTGHFLEEYRTTTHKGASYRHGFTDRKRIAVVVTKAPRYGVLNAFIDNHLVKRIDLSASRTHKKQVMLVKKFTSKHSGQLKLVVASAGRTVILEAVGYSSR